MVQLESQGGMAVLPEGIALPALKQLAQATERVHQVEVAEGAPVRGS